MYTRILVPLDGSERSEAILPLVYLLASAESAEVVFLRAAEYPYALYAACYEYPPADPRMAESIQDQKQAIFQGVRDYLERVAAGAAGVKVRIEVSERPAVEAILEAIACLRVDLVAMSTGVGPGVGAIPDRVLQEAKVPVILINGDALPRAYFHSSLPVSLSHPAMT